MLTLAPLIVNAALLGQRHARVLAHGIDGGWWDEIVVLALLAVIVTAIWLFLRGDGDNRSQGSPGT